MDPIIGWVLGFAVLYGLFLFCVLYGLTAERRSRHESSDPRTLSNLAAHQRIRDRAYYVDGPGTAQLTTSADVPTKETT